MASNSSSERGLLRMTTSLAEQWCRDGTLQVLWTQKLTCCSRGSEPRNSSATRRRSLTRRSGAAANQKSPDDYSSSCSARKTMWDCTVSDTAAIRRDVHRTLPQEELFRERQGKGQQALFRQGSGKHPLACFLSAGIVPARSVQIAPGAGHPPVGCRLLSLGCNGLCTPLLLRVHRSAQ